LKKNINKLTYTPLKRTIAGGTTLAILSAFYIFDFSPKKGLSNLQKPGEQNSTDHNSSTGERGLESNAGSGREKQNANETTGSNTQTGNTVESYPDSKGGYKKRINSEAGMKQGTAEKAPTKGYESVDDKAAASKSPGGRGTTSGKQEGLSNTDTKYSIDLTNNPDKSQKGEGTPETAKLKGTVDVGRPLSS